MSTGRFSRIPLRVGAIIVWQGERGFAEVQGTKICDRDLDVSPTATQWRNELEALSVLRNEEIEQELAGNAYCGCAEHGGKDKDRWISISEFSVNKRTGKRRTWCKKCFAAYERKRYASEIAETEGRAVRGYTRRADAA